MNALAPTSIEQVRQLVREHERVLPRGGGTKAALFAGGDGRAAIVEMAGLSGMVEYDPGEFTFTALAGTPLRQITATLAEHGQYLPFDPPLIEAGATLGGTVAAGLSGPGRLRYGGLRDFLIGVRFVDGHGTLVHGGGKVVKNAAGFDLPKLMAGSLGRLGVVVELSLKVFPRPSASTTLRFQSPDLAETLAAIARLAAAPLDLDALELEPPGTLVIRLAGDPESLAARARRVEQFLAWPATVMEENQARAYWRAIGEFAWVGERECLVKTPTTPARIVALEARLESLGVARRYSVAGNVAWIGWPDRIDLDSLDRLLAELKLSGLTIRGSARRCRLGVNPGQSLALRVKKALDPAGRFGEL